MQRPLLQFYAKMQTFLMGQEGQDLVEFALLNTLVAAIAQFFRFLENAWSSLHFHFEHPGNFGCGL